MNPRPQRDPQGICPSDFAARKAFFGFGEPEARLLEGVGPRLAKARARFVDRFYTHLLSFEETRALLRDPATLERLKRAQARYFEELWAGDYGLEYGRGRFQVGVAHHRVGLEPKWFVGAYLLYLRLLLPEVWRAMSGDWGRTLPVLEAFLKVVFLDMSISLDAYRAADRQHILDLKRVNEKIVASVPAGLLVVGADLRVASVNRSFVDACRCPRDVIVGRPVSEVLGVSKVEPHLRRVQATDTPVSGLIFTARCPRTGTPRPVRVAVAGIRVAEEEEEEEELLVVVEDLSEEERLAGLARASERRFEELVEHATDGVVLTDKDGVITYFNRSAEAMFGWQRQEVRGRPFAMLVPERYRAAFERAGEGYLATGRSSLLGSLRQMEGLHKDGRVFPVELSMSAYSTDDGEVVFTAILRDITERLRAEEALRRSEANFRTLIERSPEGIAVHREGRLVYVNPALLSYLGYDRPEELVGRPVLEVVHPDDRGEVEARIGRMVKTGEAASAREIQLVRRDGTARVAEAVALPVVFDGEPAIVAVTRDVTERRDLAAKMMQMDRMIALGTLAGGVAHEINNPLAYVIANLDFVARELPQVSALLAAHRRGAGAGGDSQEGAEGEGAERDAARRLADLQQVLQEAREGAERVRSIVRDLKTFSRPDVEVQEPVAVRQVLESAVNMAWNEIRHRARLVKDYSPTPPVLANESRLGQVFLNLLVNAAQAIPEGRAEASEIRIRTFVEGDRVCVEIRDTGTGIAPEHLPRIFDPFFTTKPPGHGTGLGLSICRGIVEAHGGEIRVQSRLGKGSVVRVLLPATHVEVPEPRPAPPVEPGRRGRILVVDDEPRIGSTLRRILGLEHDVVALASGPEVLERLAAGESFDLILCDLMMPEMTGMQLYAEVSRAYPDYASRIIFLTGGAFTPQAREFLDRVPNQRIEKPFDVQNLRALIRALVR